MQLVTVLCPPLLGTGFPTSSLTNPSPRCLTPVGSSKTRVTLADGAGGVALYEKGLVRRGRSRQSGGTTHPDQSPTQLWRPRPQITLPVVRLAPSAQARPRPMLSTTIWVFEWSLQAMQAAQALASHLKQLVKGRGGFSPCSNKLRGDLAGTLVT